jgi:hypothetical protein
MNKKIILVDIDGTVADSSKRLKKVGFDPSKPPNEWPKKWGDVSKDLPIKPIVDLVGYLQYKYETFYVTIRDIGEQEKTVKWLNKHKLFADLAHTYCIGDITGQTPDVTSLKKDFVEKTLVDLKLRDNIAFAIEDSPKMIEMYRDLGITCLDVGKFFGSM